MTEPQTDTPLRAELERTLGPVTTADLRAHLARDAVVMVRAGISLLDCALALALNDTSAVAQWLAEGTLARVDARTREAHFAHDEGSWLAVIVQPFVLVQSLA
ncbi:MAG: DUF2288 family protein [Deltaproteobacteria bacterium]|nr:DUF2288 family protein [Deltaproteobacteria bacterium]